MVVEPRRVVVRSTRAKRSEALVGMGARGRLSPPTICSRRADRRSAVFASGNGGRNGFKNYSRRSEVSCK